MKFSIKLRQPWRYRHRSRGMQTMAAGVYRVPDDLAEEMALRALGEGMAERVNSPGIAPPKAHERVEWSEPEQPAKRKRGRPPGRKALGPAPENKSAMG